MNRIDKSPKNYPSGFIKFTLRKVTLKALTDPVNTIGVVDDFNHQSHVCRRGIAAFEGEELGSPLFEKATINKVTY